MSRRFMRWSRRGLITWFSIGAVVSVVALASIGFRAMTEWQRSAELVGQRSADASVDLLYTAVTRDMRAVQGTVLSVLRVEDGSPSVALDVNAVASAFARYPYPAAFFAARMGAPGGPMTFYSRANRPAAWLPGVDPDMPFPVVTVTQPAIGDQLLERIGRDFRLRKPLAAFDVTLGGVPCQVVALLTYADSSRTRIDSALGFVVDLDWVRRHYFQEVTAQIGHIRGADPGLRLAVMDADGIIRAGGASDDSRAPSSNRRFPLLFLDPVTLDLDRPADLTTEWWAASARISGAHEVTTVRTAARATFLIASMSALVLAGGLGLGARAVQARSRLTDMRADFVAAVSHELKTPTATIRAIGENFHRRASIDDATRREYGEIVVHEAKRLTRLIDNLLAYARIADTTEVYAFKATSLPAVVHACISEFRYRLDTDPFEVSVDLSDDLPPIRADAPALSLAIGNLLDNAIRYSDDRRRLAVAARLVGGEMVLTV
ncbi:MAG: sensor histidine kinase, partial [Vicinamibacterales bacterium]